MEPSQPSRQEPGDDSQYERSAPASPEAIGDRTVNPYVSAPDPQIVTAELVSEPTADLMPRPRIWTSLAIAGISLGTFLVTSSVMLLVTMLLVHGKLNLELLRDTGAIEAVSRSRAGLLVLIVIPQLALVLPSLCAAVLSPVDTGRRLSMVRGHWPLWAWFAGAAATPLVGLISGLITGVFLDESESLKQMSAIFREHGQSGFLIPLALLIGATPAFCEELLFRGYVQTRLVRSLGPAAGVVIASLLFAAFHMDFVHIIAVFPLGLFLGWLAWRSGSIYPAMLGHFVNNVISVFAVVVAPEGQTDVLSLPTVAISLSVISAGILGMTAVSIAAILYGRPPTVVQTN